MNADERGLVTFFPRPPRLSASKKNKKTLCPLRSLR